jgi:hypothetical protein
LPVGIIRSSARSLVMVACTAFAVSCARSAPPPELPITAQVIVSRVISEDVPSRPSDCPIETLAALPTQPYRELGTIEISDADPNRHDTRVLIDQHACAMGADAVLISPAPASQGGVVEATAIAYASGIADRVAKIRATKAAAASPPPSLPKTPVPEVEEITPAGSPQSASAGADDSEEELPPETLVPIRELQIGPAEAPSPTPGTPLTPVTPSAAQPAADTTSPTSPIRTAGAELSTASAPIPAASTPAGSARAPLTSSASTPQPPAQILRPIPAQAGVLPPAPATTLPPAPIAARRGDPPPLPTARHKD